MDSAGRNLFAPGDSRQSRLVFLHFLTAFLAGLHRHNDLLQSVLASPENELRLGGHEAPPAIISVYLGQELQQIIGDMAGFIATRAKRRPMIRVEDMLPPILHDLSDRNRTSPVAFTGNKFEFRMPGASASIAFPLAVINLIMADGLAEVQTRLVGAGDDAAALKTLAACIAEHAGIIFEGDNYSAEWKEEAARRHLFIPVSVPDTIDCLKTPKNVALFETHRLLQRDEIEARADIKIEIYWKAVEIELRVARYMLRAHIIPAALRNQELLLGAVRDYPAGITQAKPQILANQHRFIEKFTLRINQLMEMLSQLDEDNDRLKEGDDRAKAHLCSAVIRPRLAEAAVLAEKVEERVDRQFWTMPRVADLMLR
jgi:glutamine synthetase